MNRNIAFFISSNNDNDPQYIKAMKHFKGLADRYRFNMSSYDYKKLHIHIIHQNQLTYTDSGELRLGGGRIQFNIGNFNDNIIERDRFLKISICQEYVSITNDYAGTIPVYYSLRNYISISNIEPCVVIDSKTCCNDLSWENIYGYLRYMHFIWDETAYKHINIALPDSETIFNIDALTIKSNYLESISSKISLANANERQVASKLFELNRSLVKDALRDYDKIILPLSSGYDSRMIFAVLSDDAELKKKLYCYTYGGTGSVEVEAARQLSKKHRIQWRSIELPCKFLQQDRQQKIFDIFGSSLHMHGMYQLEFFEEVYKWNKNLSNTCLTSGFMTGVPAGQHNYILNIKNKTDKLTKAMDNFSQSKYWLNDELNEIRVFKDKNYIEAAEFRFRKAFDRFNGEIFQKAVVFDVWTRQRNFISYYPRTLEWIIPTVSPHMNIEYINFFMSLNKEYLDNRKAVELMFLFHYPKCAKIISNSNGLGIIANNSVENLLFFIYNKLHTRKLKLNRLKLYNLLPKIFQNIPFEFDIPALKNTGKEGVYPLFNYEKYEGNIFGEIFIDKIEWLYNNAINGDIKSHEKLILLQPLIWASISLFENE